MIQLKPQARQGGVWILQRRPTGAHRGVDRRGQRRRAVLRTHRHHRQAAARRGRRPCPGIPHTLCSGRRTFRPLDHRPVRRWLVRPQALYCWWVVLLSSARQQWFSRLRHWRPGCGNRHGLWPGQALWHLRGLEFQTNSRDRRTSLRGEPRRDPERGGSSEGGQRHRHREHMPAGTDPAGCRQHGRGRHGSRLPGWSCWRRLQLINQSLARSRKNRFPHPRDKWRPTGRPAPHRRPEARPLPCRRRCQPPRRDLRQTQRPGAVHADDVHRQARLEGQPAVGRYGPERRARRRPVGSSPVGHWRREQGVSWGGNRSSGRKPEDSPADWRRLDPSRPAPGRCGAILGLKPCRGLENGLQAGCDSLQAGFMRNPIRRGRKSGPSGSGLPGHRLRLRPRRPPRPQSKLRFGSDHHQLAPLERTG